MALYTYRALDKQGEIIQDKTEGSGEMAVAHELRQQGLTGHRRKRAERRQKDILAPFKGIRLADLVVFSRQLATMINAGLPIVRRSHVLSEQTENPKLVDVVVAVRKDVEAGLPLRGPREAPRGLSRLYVEMVKAGRSGHPRRRPAAPGRPVGEGSGPQAQDQERADLPYRGSGPRDPGRLFHAHLHSACIRRDVPGPGGRSRCQPGFACSSPTS